MEHFHTATKNGSSCQNEIATSTSLSETFLDTNAHFASRIHAAFKTIEESLRDIFPLLLQDNFEFLGVSRRTSSFRNTSTKASEACSIGLKVRGENGPCDKFNITFQCVRYLTMRSTVDSHCCP